MPDDRIAYVTLRQAARVLDTSATSVSRALKAGRLAAERVKGRRELFIPVAEIHRRGIEQERIERVVNGRQPGVRIAKLERALREIIATCGVMSASGALDVLAEIAERALRD